MYFVINKSVLETGLAEVLKNFVGILNRNDFKTVKLYLFQQAYDAIVEAVHNGYYEDKDILEHPNYTEICEWCEWPDLQDSGIFEQAIDAAWNAVRYSYGYLPLEVEPYVKKYGKLN